MRRGMMAGGAMGLGQMRFCRFGMMQRVRDVQRRRVLKQRSTTEQNQSKRPNPRQSHAASILSNHGFLAVRLPRGGAHLTYLSTDPHTTFMQLATATSGPCRLLHTTYRSATLSN